MAKHCRFSYTDANSIKQQACIDHEVSVAQQIVGRKAKGAKAGDLAWVIHTPAPGKRIISIGRIVAENVTTDTWLSRGGPREWNEYRVEWIRTLVPLDTKWNPLGDESFAKITGKNEYAKMLPKVLAAPTLP